MVIPTFIVTIKPIFLTLPLNKRVIFTKLLRQLSCTWRHTTSTTCFHASLNTSNFSQYTNSQLRKISLTKNTDSSLMINYYFLTLSFSSHSLGIASFIVWSWWCFVEPITSCVLYIHNYEDLNCVYHTIISLLILCTKITSTLFVT